ncbi:MAG TPA: homoserine kinase [Sediminibacterium sp.]|uniref:homoserine kinase n=1 Tax=Sediminibacterium sp. TaxID=1917865 RepID=UPI0008BA310A|nr:homoserine kinase [Sediminibacterium sp.]OHC86613.1 MAG: homoserine kinase [Sphingobacteriia bacterium RIFOXYC2_FULL_35_18]OHC88530.1 MAG: homoserine kinase [Sphingobacteriia bacterium RIFOXYD2_FULL_35_12]HLD52035.1 homoserine kinase [Sediminibacterium sp.]
MANKITIHSPATVANMVCGFDVLGFAVNDPFDIMYIEFKVEPGITIVNEDDFNLPTDPQQNVAGAALLALMEAYEKPVGFKLTINKQIKPGSGVGSSAASSAGAVVGANAILGNPFSKEDLVRFAMNGEKLASGVKHADNIAPCIYGGVTLIRSVFPLDIIKLTVPDLYVTIVHPQIEVRTADARSILKQQILLKDAIKQWGNIAGLVAGLEQGNYELIGRSLEDVLIEPTRSILIPAFDQVKKISKELGALGGGISGSGPSIFMLSTNEFTAKSVEIAMGQIYDSIGLSYHTYVTTINTNGIQLMEAS